MTREEAIEVYNGLINTKIKEAFEFFAPELRESEDEMMEKAIVDALLSHCNSINLLSERGYQIEDVKAWLEKQKEQKPNYCHYGGDPNIERCRCCSAACSGILADEQKPAEWKPQPESLEALMYAIEGKWEMIKPTSYLSRRLEDLYDGLVNTYNVDETLFAELSKTAYYAKDIEELRALKDKIDASMDEKPEWSDEDDEIFNNIIEKAKGGHWIEVNEITWLINRFKSLRPQLHKDIVLKT